MGMYRTTIRGNQDAQIIEVVMGWMTNTTTGTANALTLATSVYNHWVSDILPDLVDDYEVTEVIAVGVDNPLVVANFTGSAFGTNGGNPAPMFSVANVKLSTGVRGRSYQGRFGIPGLSVNQLEPNNGNMLEATTVLPLFQGNVSTFIAGVSGSFGTASQNAVISTISGGTPRPSPIATPITTATVQAALGSRVSRKG